MSKKGGSLPVHDVATIWAGWRGAYERGENYHIFSDLPGIQVLTAALEVSPSFSQNNLRDKDIEDVIIRFSANPDNLCGETR